MDLSTNMWNAVYDFFSGILGTSDSALLGIFAEETTLLVCLFLLGFPFFCCLMFFKWVWGCIK